MYRNEKPRAPWHRVAKTSVVGLLALGVFAGAAQSQVVVSGNARGCFGAGCTPLDNDRLKVEGVWLKYVSAPKFDFQGITAGGFLAINNAGGSGNFGILSGGPTPRGTVINTPFTLSLGFLTPWAPNSLFTAVITGHIVSTVTGSLIAMFNPASISSPFYDPYNRLSGDLTVTALDTPIPAIGSAPITGYVQVSNVVPATVTPEPVTIVMVGSGLLGLAVARRRRKVTQVE